MKKRLLASLLSLCLLVGLLPTAALAADEAQDSETPAVCTELDGCIEDAHDEGCPLYAAQEEAPMEDTETPEEPTPANPVEEPEDTAHGAGELTAQEQFAALIAALPAPAEVDPLDEEQVKTVYNQISAIYAFAEENGLDVEDNEAVNAVIEALYPVETLEDTGGQGTQENPWNISAEGEGNNVIAYLTQNNGDVNAPTYTLTISGTGAMKDFVYKKDTTTQKFGSDAPWYTSLTRNDSTKMFPITELVIGDGVTYIGAAAFASLSVKTVSFASNVAGYGKYVFIDCALTETVDWSGFTPTAIPEGLLYGNSNLVNSKIDGTTYENKIVIPEGIDTVGTSAFLSCTSLMEIDLSNITKSIGANAFGGCTKLKTVKLPAAVNSGCEASYFGTRCFNTTAIETITLPNNVTTISEAMFNRCGLLTDVVTTNSITKIEKQAFFCDKDSTGGQERSDNQYSSFVGNSLDLSSVTEIGDAAFNTCSSLKKIIRLDSIQSLGERAFCDSSSVQVVDMSKASSLKTTSSNALGNLSDGSIIYISSNDAGSLTGNYQGVYTDERTALAVTNGGTFGADTQFTANTLATPTKDGCIFAGWYTSSEFTEGTKVTGNTISKSDSTEYPTYYAKWIELNAEDISMEYGSEKALSDITINGVTLTGWTSADNNVVKVEGDKLVATGVGETTITANASLTRSGEKLTVNVKVTPMPITFGSGTDENPGGTITYAFTGMAPEFSQFAKFYPAKVNDNSVSIVEGSDPITLTEGEDIVFIYNAGSGENEYDYLPVNVTDDQTYGIEVTVKLINDNYRFVTTDSTELTQTIKEKVIVKADNMTEVPIMGLPTIGENLSYAYNGAGIAPIGNLTRITAGSIDKFTVHFHPWGNTELTEAHLQDKAATELTQEEIQKIAPKEPGSYLMIVDGKSDTEYVYQSWIYTITKATVTITPINKTAYVGDELPTLGEDDYTVTGLVGNDTLSKAPTLSYEGTPDMSKADTYTINASGATADETHYTLVYQDGTLTVRTRSSSGGGGGSSSSGSTGNVTGSGDDVNIDVSGSSVTAAQMEKAVDRADRGETITIDASHRSSVSLPSSGLQDAADNNNDVTVELKDGEVTLSPEALSAVADQAGTTVTLTVEPVDTDELNSRQQAAVGDAPVFDLTLKSGGRTITDFDGGLVTVAIPYELPDGQDPAGVVVWFMDDNGNITACETMYDLRTEMVIFTTRHFSKYVIGYEEPMNFTDVPADAYYADAVKWAVANGITSGTGDGTTFSPDMSCTRAQMVTFLWRAAGSPVVNYAMSFTDVPADAYYAEAVRWALSQGITAGTGDGSTFSPDAVLTRGQTVTFLWRANGSPAVSGASFADVDANAYYADAVAWAVREGITSGTGNNTFSPDADCTRCQIVTFMFRSAN